MSDLAAIQGWVANVQSAMAGLSSQVQQAAESGGDFAAVFSEAQAVLAGTSSGATSTGAETSGTSSSESDASDATDATDSAALDGTSAASLLSGAGSTSTTGDAVVTTAEKYLGVPYVWGGTTPSGFDCSGFTQYVYGQLGISLPRTADEQSTVGTAVSSLADAEPGDLVFFAGADGTATAPGHVGIYLGDGEMIDAPETGEDVSIQPVSSAGAVVAIRRVIPSGTASGTDDVATTGTTVLTDAVSSSTSGAGASSSSVSVPSSLAPTFESAAQQYGVPVTLLAAIAQVESGYDTDAVSSSGAEGLMQIMPSTAASLGIDAFDPTQAIDGAAKLLSGYLAEYQSVPTALAAYNAGSDAVAAYGGVPPYGQTEEYVQEVMALSGVSSTTGTGASGTATGTGASSATVSSDGSLA